jgi:hypothetical protein
MIQAVTSAWSLRRAVAFLVRVNMPKGIQLKRTRGYRKPPDAIVVSRPSRWGNPYVVGAPGAPDAPTAVALFEKWLLASDDPRAKWMRANL